VIKIAITGPESTGKSTLCELLAKSYHTIYVPEYARDYIEKLNHPYSYEDLLEIAKVQIRLEGQLSSIANKLIFCDTDLTVIKIWSEHKFGKCHSWILDKLNEIRYDYYFLCNIDIPWEFDEQREHPHLRQYFFDLYRKEMDSRNLPYYIISGLENERLLTCKKIIDKYLQNN
jgi:NadR type nicotinamide-nucleotide adenylyltransferase